MKIVHVPHASLRNKSKLIERVDDKLSTFITQFEDVLLKKENPKGVGLSAPQVNHSQAIFSTYLSERDDDSDPILNTYINPEILSTSKDRTFGEDPSHPILEGCLSIPGLYGPVPRFSWVELGFEIIEKNAFKKKYKTFYDFEARVIQHEYDHLQGTLFTDYILEYDLPLYDDTTGKMIKINNKIAKKF